jgi:hypothetical protein
MSEAMAEPGDEVILLVYRPLEAPFLFPNQFNKNSFN